MAEEPRIERRRRDALKRVVSYRWFSFLRRQPLGMEEGDVRVLRGLRPGDGGTAAAGDQTVRRAETDHRRLAGEVLNLVKPGDVFVTRHDDAMSNLFLPGFWPHAALYLGTSEDLERMGIALPAGEAGGHWFLESKKDGVRIRPAEETLQVDAFVVLRPPLERSDLTDAIRRAVEPCGKPYDFLFDFRTADRMVCTEVIYRGFHGIGSGEIPPEGGGRPLVSAGGGVS